jgi:phage tail sheath protein FI
MIEDPDSGRGGDLLYVMASPYNVTPDELTDKFDTVDIDSSYACTYAPWAMYYDNSNKKYISLPVTRDVVKNMASVDNNSFPWFAPAGVERGSVSCIKAEYKTTLATEDELYENRINPVKTFAKDGVKIWGNKTTYKAESPLNRINVRRLMIRIKKLILNATRSLIFDQYSDSLEDQFKDIVNPILLDVKKNRGIFDFKVITSVTPEARDQHILPAKILIKPTPSLEYISISFVVYPESVNFEE